MDGSDFQFRKAFFQALADEPLEPGDPRYVNLSGLPGRHAAEQLAETIRLSSGQSVQIFSGTEGTGKTTELKRLRALLHGAGYTVVYVDMHNYVSTSTPINFGEFGLALATAFSDALRGIGLLGDAARQQQIGDRISLNSNNWVLLRELRAFLIGGIAELRKRYAQGGKIVLLVDSLDHLGRRGEARGEILDSVDGLFRDHISRMSIPDLHVVYSVPFWLIETPRRLATYEHTVILWDLPVADNLGKTITALTADSFHEIVARRAKTLRVAGIGDDRRLEKVIHASWGNIRDFLRILRQALLNAKSLPLDDSAVQMAIDAIRAPYLVPVGLGSKQPTPPKKSTRPDTVDPAKLAIGIRTLRLAHIRLFADLTLDFTRDDKPRPFTLILAENGHGKTTVLQAIALAASGVAGANLLAGNAAAFFDRRFQPVNDEGDKFCRMEAIFDTSRRDENSTMETRFATLPTWKEFRSDGSSPMDDVRAQDKPQWFVAGYGTSRMLPRSRASKEQGRRSVDRLRSLFEAEPLVATGFADILADLLGPSVARDYAATLRTVLIGDGQTPGLLPHDEALHVEELELRGSGAVRESTDLVDADRFVLKLGETRIKLPASWLSAGYQSTIAWVADLLGQVTLEVGRVLQPDEISGIVLIDEIDLHLHPQWQASLVPSLRVIFPKVQFIATTHSPMVLPGLRQDEIIMLSLDMQGNIQQKAAPVAPALKTGSEILEWFFGIEKLYPAELGQVLQEYTFLASDAERSDEEDSRMQALRKKLQEADADPGWEPQSRIVREDDQ